MFIWPDPSPGEEAGDDASVPVKKRKSTSKQPKVMTRTPLVTLAGHTQPAVTVRWPTEDELLTGGWDHCIRLWDMATGVNKSTLVGRQDKIWCWGWVKSRSKLSGVFYLYASFRMVQRCSMISTKALHCHTSSHRPIQTSSSEYGTSGSIVRGMAFNNWVSHVLFSFFLFFFFSFSFFLFFFRHYP